MFRVEPGDHRASESCLRPSFVYSKGRPSSEPRRQHIESRSFKEKQHVSVDLKSGTPVWADLQSISLHAKAASGIKRVIKASLVIQISHAYGVMSESGLREQRRKTISSGGGV